MIRLLTTLGKHRQILKMLRKEGKEDFELVDDVDNLRELEVMISLMPIEGLILSGQLDELEEEEMLESICRKAVQKKAKILVLVTGYETFQEKRLITTLVNVGVTAFLKLEEVTYLKIKGIFDNYPDQFDWNTLVEGTASEADEDVIEEKVEIRKEYVSVIKSVFKELITVYSPLSQGASTVAAHLAMAIAGTQELRVCLVDFNPLKPSLRRFFSQDFSFTLVNVLNALERESLTNEKLEGLLTPCKQQKNLDLLPGIYDLNEYYHYGSQGSFSKMLDQLLEKLKFLYDYVIVDVHSYHDLIMTNQALLKADQVVVPVYGSRYDVSEVNRYITTFETYGDFDVRRFRYVINRYGQEDLTFLELESALKGEIIGYLRENHLYRSENTFGNQKVMQEYGELLKGLGVKVPMKRQSFWSLPLKFTQRG